MTDKTTDDRPLPTVHRPSRADLLRRHTEARRRRDAAPLGGPDWAAAATEVSDLEIRISAIEVVEAGGEYAEPAKGAIIETSHH
jgi:hypothetical protein